MASTRNVEQLRNLSPEKIRQLAEAAARKKARAAGPELRRHEGRTEYPLSFEQERLWFLDQLHPGSVAYNWPVATVVSPEIDPRAWGQAIESLVARHEILRTVFATRDGEPFQRVLDDVRVELQCVDLSHLEEGRREEAARAIVDAELNRPFDLAAGPLFRCGLIRAGAGVSIPWFVFHHTITDGWSTGVMIGELSAFMRRIVTGGGEDLAPLNVQYGDFAVWQRARFAGEAAERLRGYWASKLRGLTPLDFPADFRRTAASDEGGATAWFDIPASLARGLDDFARGQGQTLFSVMLAAFQCLLSRYTGARDIGVAVPVSSRLHRETERLIGFFVNTMIIRGDLGDDPTFAECVRRTAEVCREAYAHQEMPFGELIKELNPARELSRNPLTQIAFQVEEKLPEAQAGAPGGGSARGIDVELRSVFFDIDVHIRASREGGSRQIRGMVTYSTALFTPATIERLMLHYRRLLERLVKDPHRPLSAVPLLDEAEVAGLLEWAGGGRPVEQRTVLQLFAEQVRSCPRASAVRCEGRELSYAELDGAAGRLARRLAAAGVRPGGVVAVNLGRSLEIIPAVLGVMKAGAAYVVLDPDSPPERVRYVLEDSRAGVLVGRGPAPDLPPGVVFVEVEPAGEAACEDAGAGQDDTAAWPGPESVAYLIYTSGSTGRPKGVCVTHHNLAQYVRAVSDRLGLSAGSNYALVTTLAADLGYTMLYPSLCVGGCLHLGAGPALSDPDLFGEWMEASEIDYLKITPSYLNALAAGSRPGSVMPRRGLVLGGESLDESVAAKFQGLRPGCRIFNHYGPSECTVGVVTHEFAAGGGGATVPLGRPLEHSSLYVLDARMNPAPVGVVGELFIGGRGVGQGYLRPELTADRFVPDPFGREGGSRLYRTGDLARWLPGGLLEFLGRADDQIKLRGYRVELKEIEAVLRGLDGIREAAVAALPAAGGDKILVGYVVPAKGRAFEQREVDDALARRLPDYMRPTSWVLLEELPRGPSGKIDRRALPAPERQNAATRPQAEPRDEVERGLVEIWKSLLNAEAVGVDENFFQLGGHSLLAIKLVARIRQAYGVSLPVASLFQHGTVESLARVLRGEQAAAGVGPLVTLRAGDEGRPLFLVHPAGGDVFCYLELARRIRAGCHVYGLQDVFVSDDGQAVTVGAMAERYLREVKRVQPVGPYQFAGWSLGGLLAYEMARRLEAENETVSFLGVLDFTVSDAQPDAVHADVTDAASLATIGRRLATYAGVNIDLSAEEFEGSESPSERLSAFAARMKELGLLPPEVGAEFWPRFLRTYHRNVTSVARYQPGDYAGRIQLFRSSELVAETEQQRAEREDPYLGWRRHCPGRVSVREVPGNHMTMMTPPHVETLARVMSEYLEG